MAGRKPVDISGRRFGRLFAVEPTDRRERGSIVWKFRCDCGQIVERQARAVNIATGQRSCGCLRRQHGGSRSRLYGIWKAMRQRCRDPNIAHFRNYGARGIKVCSAWDGSFSIFRDWALSNGYDDSLTIDRIDNEAGYEPGNCRWVTMAVQIKNRRPFTKPVNVGI